MRNSEVISVHVPTQTLAIDRREAAVRLKTARSFEHRTISLCEERLKKVIRYRYAYRRVPVSFIDEDTCELGFGALHSRDLCRALAGCREAFLLGATTGLGVDRLLARLKLTSAAECFITDALSSAAAETLCDYADTALRGGGQKPMRFSPGYGDLSLSCQPALLQALDASRTLGITLNTALLMTPMKSVTAILGI